MAETVREPNEAHRLDFDGGIADTWARGRHEYIGSAAVPGVTFPAEQGDLES